MSEEKKIPFAAEVWKTLSAVNVNEQIEKKGNLSYLSWAWAWGKLMEHYPESAYVILPEEWQDDGTVMCGVSLFVKKSGEYVERSMWLPVMDNRNNAVQNPTTRQVSDTRMRCLVKAIAMFGLGFYIYAGEDLPSAEKRAVDHTPVTKKQAATLRDELESVGGDEHAFCKYLKVDALEQIEARNYDLARSMIAKKRSAK